MPLSGRLITALRQPALKKVRAFFCDDHAATAVEFGLLALPFFAMVCAILQTAVIFLASQLLDNAVQDASRMIRTGQAQTANYDLGDFNLKAVCPGLAGIFDCNKLETRVTTVTNFASATVSSPIDPGQTDPTKWKLETLFQPGTGSSVVLVQVYYKWPVLLNFGGLNLATSADGTHLLSAVRVFENEPFTS